MEGQKLRATRGQIGQYLLTERIGAGSFAVVYKAKHVSRGHVVAIKEIVTDWLHEKLIQGLYSEIQILQKISHPNIVRLHDIISLAYTVMECHVQPSLPESWDSAHAIACAFLRLCRLHASDRIFLVLEYCAGGDLAAYIQQHKRVSQAVARNIMKQLGAGLEVLRANNLIHRDLKPQNLLLTTSNDNAVLKIADFGFARSLQPQGLAETHCGSPLYMAPEILQYQKYDAKADLWSVGAILYQLVTGHPPFSGSSHVQLMKNIRKTLHFPGNLVTELHPDCVDLCRKLLCQNPVERLSFEEFFNHPFIQAERSHEHISETPSAHLKQGRIQSLLSFTDGQGDGKHTDSSIQRDAMLDLTSNLGLRSSHKQIYLKSVNDQIPAVDLRHSGVAATLGNTSREGDDRSMSEAASRGGTLVDSLESIEREYVLVNTPLTSTDMVLTLSGREQFASRGDCSLSANSLQLKGLGPALTACEKAESIPDAQPLFHPTGSEKFCDGSRGPTGASRCAPVRLASLQQCARVIADLAMEKFHAGQPPAAFSLHLVCLSIWKEALHLCQTWAAATAGGLRADGIVDGGKPDHPASFSLSCYADVGHEYVAACENGEALAAHLSSLDAHDGIPDAIELIFQAALVAGRNAAVGEVLGNMVKASMVYAKSATLFHFLLQEAPLLPLKPPFMLTISQRSQLSAIAHRVAERQAKCGLQLNRHSLELRPLD